jgi:excisionase family DNA binding protein
MKSLIGSGEVARVLRVSVDTVRAWADQGRIKSERSAAGRRLFYASDIERLARSRTLARGPR